MCQHIKAQKFDMAIISTAEKVARKVYTEAPWNLGPVRNLFGTTWILNLITQTKPTVHPRQFWKKKRLYQPYMITGYEETKYTLSFLPVPTTHWQGNLQYN